MEVQEQTQMQTRSPGHSLEANILGAWRHVLDMDPTGKVNHRNQTTAVSINKVQLLGKSLIQNNFIHSEFS